MTEDPSADFSVQEAELAVIWLNYIRLSGQLTTMLDKFHNQRNPAGFVIPSQETKKIRGRQLKMVSSGKLFHAVKGVERPTPNTVQTEDDEN